MASRACADNDCPTTRKSAILDAAVGAGLSVAAFASCERLARALRVDSEKMVCPPGARDDSGEAYPGTGANRPDAATAEMAIAHLERDRPDFLFVGRYNTALGGGLDVLFGGGEATTKVVGLSPPKPCPAARVSATSHMAYELDRASTSQPSLAEMTTSALDVLGHASKGKGWFLMVEGGRIDHALHATSAKRALEDVKSFDAAISAAPREGRSLGDARCRHRRPRSHDGDQRLRQAGQLDPRRRPRS